MKKVMGVLLVVLTVMISQADATIQIDFNDLSQGDMLTNQYQSSGVVFSLIDSPLVTPRRYQAGATVRTANATQLSRYPGMTGNFFTPRDMNWLPYSNGDTVYDVVMDFSRPIDFFSLDAYDADENLTVNGYLDGVLVASSFFPRGTNYQHHHVDLGSVGGFLRFDQVVLDLVNDPSLNNPNAICCTAGPEIYDNLAYNTVPEPATLSLLGMSIFGIAGLRRKKIIS